jgi:hypothetical protein
MFLIANRAPPHHYLLLLLLLLHALVVSDNLIAKHIHALRSSDIPANLD